MRGVEIGTHMNGDEAMALGTAFLAANLSSSFRVRPIYMNDGLEQSIKVRIRNLDNTINIE